jgi:hypothetical protein
MLTAVSVLPPIVTCREEHNVANVIWEVVDRQVLASEACLNVFHFLDTTGVNPVTDLLDDLIANYIPAAAGLQHVSLTHQDLLYRQVYPTQQLQHTYSVGLPIAGALSGSDAAANAYALSMAWLIGATVNLGAGSPPYLKRGGMRLPGPTEGDLSGNTVPGSVVSAWLTAFGTLTPVAGGDFTFIVASFLNAGRVRQHTVQQYAPVLGTSSPAPSTQNSRKILRGHIS